MTDTPDRSMTCRTAGSTDGDESDTTEAPPTQAGADVAPELLFLG